MADGCSRDCRKLVSVFRSSPIRFWGWMLTENETRKYFLSIGFVQNQCWSPPTWGQKHQFVSTLVFFLHSGRQAGRQADLFAGTKRVVSAISATRSRGLLDL